jgi:import inner membrane translocase subunit TIM21
VDQVKKDARCIELLGDAKKVTAYGEPTWNKWARARPLAYGYSSDEQKDKC